MERSRVRRETRVNGTQPERIVDAKLGPSKNCDPAKIATKQKLGSRKNWDPEKVRTQPERMVDATSNFVKLPAATTEWGRDSMVVLAPRKDSS